MAEIILRPINRDNIWFIEHPDRKAHIRLPEDREMQKEFWTLGPHDFRRRRVLLWRVPTGHPMKQRFPVLQIPFLAFADETIEDDDKVLLPLIDQIMKDAAKSQGMLYE